MEYENEGHAYAQLGFGNLFFSGGQIVDYKDVLHSKIKDGFQKFHTVLLKAKSSFKYEWVCLVDAQ